MAKWRSVGNDDLYQIPKPPEHFNKNSNSAYLGEGVTFVHG